MILIQDAPGTMYHVRNGKHRKVFVRQGTTLTVPLHFISVGLLYLNYINNLNSGVSNAVEQGLRCVSFLRPIFLNG